MDAFDIHAQINLGSIEIALVVSLVLFGVLIHQVHTYYRTFNDRAFLKVLATTVLIMEIAHTVTIIHTIYFVTVTQHGVLRIEPNSYPLTTSVVFETLITLLVQGFFAWRIFRLSERLHISMVCWVLSLFRFGSGLALAGESYLSVPKQAINTFALTDNFGWLITLAVTVGAFVDVLIALTLCYYIKSFAPSSPSKRVVALVNRLMAWTIQTGLVTSIASVAVVISFHAVRNTELWFSIYMVLAKLYSNSFFMTLNVRQRPHSEFVPSTFNKPVPVSSGTPPQYNVTLLRQRSFSTSSTRSYGQYQVPALDLPTNMSNGKGSFRRAIDKDLEARGL